MKLKNVSHYAIYDQKFDNWKSEVLDRWTYDDFVRDPQYKKKWISITSLAYHQPSDAVYLGIGSFSAELLWKFDRKAKTITSCGYEKVGEPFDAKFHRSLELDGNTLYGGVALFHDIDKQFTAKGGRLVKYDINTGEFTFLARRARRRISSPSRWIASAGSSMGLAQYRRYSFATTSTRAKAV